jgi:hypothetical protein
MKGIGLKILLLVFCMVLSSEMLLGQFNSYQFSELEKNGSYAQSVNSNFNRNRIYAGNFKEKNSILFLSLENSNDSSIVEESSVKAISFDNSFSGITIRGIHFLAYEFTLSRTKYFRSKKLAIQTGLSFGIGSNVDSSQVYDPILGNNIETIYDRRLTHMDFRSEIKYNFHRSFKKDRFISFGFMYSGDFVREKISRDTGSGISFASSSFGKIRLTPLLSYSKEKHLNERWSFNTSVYFGQNLADKSTYFYLGFGFRHRSKNPDENLFRSRRR